MQLTGAKYSQKQVMKALQDCGGDADDAIQLLLEQSRQQMFSAKVVKQDKVAVPR